MRKPQHSKKEVLMTKFQALKQNIRELKTGGKNFMLLFNRSVVSDSLRPHRPQHTRLPCPPPPPGVRTLSVPPKPHHEDDVAVLKVSPNQPKCQSPAKPPWPFLHPP